MVHFSLLYRLSLLNFDLNGAAERPTGRDPTGKRGRPPGRGGPSGEEGLARREEGPFGEEGQDRREEGALREKSTPCWRGQTVG